MRLLVPLDGSAASRHAFNYALRLASEHRDTVLILLNVQTAETLGLSDIRVRTDDELDLAARKSKAVLRDPIRVCEEHRVPCEARPEYGGPIAETIDRVARETGADQIVMGARGLGRVRSLMLGSVTTQVIHLTDVPVTLVKATRKRPISGVASRSR